MPIEGLRPVRYLEACLRAIRDAVGEGVDVMVDCHARHSPRMGLILAKAAEPFGLYWFEEPCWPESVEGLADIQRAVTTPIATGERLVGQQAFVELLGARAASVIQPDITHCGGLSEARRIGSLAEAFRVALAPHNPQGPVSTAASLELGFATPSYLICETVHLDVPWRRDVVREGFEVEPKGRIVRPGSRPGLGIEIDEAEVKKHPFQQEIVLREFYADGSVGDW
jgi:galactonate dehydratase